MDETMSLERAAERLYEDERLRADLTDDAARVLLDWAVATLERAQSRGESVADTLDRVRATGRAINDLIGGRDP
jgi:hypothetical protein